MDPDQTLRELAGAIVDGSNDYAHEMLDALMEWIACGGFVPAGLEALR